MRIKSAEASQRQAYMTRDPKDPLPNPHESEKLQNGHLKETHLLNDGRGQRLDSRGSSQRDQNDNVPQLANGQNHASYPTVIRNDHEMAVRTKVISVKRDIQPSNQNHRAKPPITPGNTVPTTLHGTAQRPVVNGDATQMLDTPPQRLSSHSDSFPRTPTTPLSPVFEPTNGVSHHEPTDSLSARNSRLSSTGSTTMPYPVSPSIQSPNYFNMTPRTKLTRQMSSYERTVSADLDRLNSELAQANISAAPKFIKDTSAFWYKPDITREQALAILRERPAGSFVVRDSRCFPGAFGLALKVDRLPPAVQHKTGVDLANEYVRHFLIETTSKGVRLKGCPNEPVFGSLSALIYQHSITPLALPCKLIIPTEDQEVPPAETDNAQNEALAAAELLKQGAACNVVYIGSLDTESLTGPMAIDQAISRAFTEAKSNPNKTSIAHFKVSPQGITLTDVQRKIFFRRHYPTSTVTFCGLDPQGGSNKKEAARRWDATTMKGGPDAWMFGFVARKQTGTNDNECHVFAELDSTQPARAIVNFVTKILIGSHRQNNS